MGRGFSLKIVDIRKQVMASKLFYKIVIWRQDSLKVVYLTEVDFNQKLDIMDEIPMPTYADFLCFINTNYRIHG